MALDTIPKQEGGKLKAVASGTLPSGQPVVVNSDGTVSVIAETSASQVVGSSTTVVPSAPYTTNYYDSAYDTNAQKVVLVYVDVSNQQRAMAVVGTVSGTSITFGTPVEYGPSTSMQYTRVVYDENAQKVVAAYHDGPNGTNTRGAARVGTISGTSISFGTATTFFSLGTAHISMAYDANAQKIVIAFQDTGDTNYAKAVVGTVSGTSISFGSSAFFTSTNTSPIAITYDANAQKCVIAYGAALTARVATVSGTSISFGTAVSLGNNIVSSALAITYDSNAQKVVVAYADQNDNQYGKVRVGTVSGTDISFGSFVTFQAATMQPISAGSPILEIAYDSTASKIALTYDDSTNSSYGTVVTGTVSGTTVVLDTPTVFNSTHSDTFTTSYDSNAGKLVLFCRNDTTSDRAEAVVFQTAYTSTNLTSENYIGMSGGVVAVAGSAEQEIGSPTVFETSFSLQMSSAYDANAQKVVIAYQDNGNSLYGTAVVGTVSGTSISFGTPVVFASANTSEIDISYDANAQKVVIAYANASLQGTAIVGTVSGTSISFGSATVFESGSTSSITTSYDVTAQKVVIAYRDESNSSYGTAVVGTVSGTSISFGSASIFESAITAFAESTYDANAQKHVIIYGDGGNSYIGTAVVGTVSGTSISFGSPVVFSSGTSTNNSIAYDATAQKVVVAHREGGNSNYGTAIVGTVSGTSISFGSPVVFLSATLTSPAATYDTTAGKVVVAYQDSGNSSYGTVISGEVSGTSISFDSASVFDNTTSSNISSVYDANAQKVVIAYRDHGNSNYGTSVVYQTGYTNITRGEVADGDNATVDIVGTVSSNQVGLTAGQQYYVQADGTIGTTPSDPSVLAGTAVSATKMVVKS